ncbi:MAG: alpha-N-arabinofuranosidase [candidate division KSB1 bacterium]|nr:alpha-N-arabinofuranosidase [candidate division KSB1 bacterium]
MKFIKCLFLVVFALATGLLNAEDSQNKKTNRIVVNADLGKETISKFIYGHFAEHLGRCIYGGIYVGEDSDIPNTRGIRNDVVEALKEIGPSVVRWPGGCFADTYHWKDGIGPKEERPSIVNTHWGGVTEDNSFGTHEFLDFCELIGAEPFICVNVGSGTVQEAADWVEYVNSDAKSPMTELRKQNGRAEPWNVKYWAVGNESWGCGGHMTPDYYADLYKRFSTYMRSGRPFRVASGGTDPDFEWTETILKKTQNYTNLIQGYSFHYYTFCHGWDDKSSATQFDENDWFYTMKNTLIMEERLEKHIALMDEYDPENKIGIMADEWGNWFDVEPGTNPGFLYQQNTLRDAVTAALYLNIYNNHARRIKMANIAQMINVLQAMLLTKEEQIVKTPTFYVFKMYKVHHDATLLPIDVVCKDYSYDGMSLPSISASASKDQNGVIHISLCNIDLHNDRSIEIDLRGSNQWSDFAGEIIAAPNKNDYNDFGKPEKVNIQEFSSFSVQNNVLKVDLPAKSVVTIALKN